MEERDLDGAADDGVNPEPPPSAEHGTGYPRPHDLPHQPQVVHRLSPRPPPELCCVFGRLSALAKTHAEGPNDGTDTLIQVEPGPARLTTRHRHPTVSYDDVNRTVQINSRNIGSTIKNI
ncbi:hypothetical protein B296_00039458 [Ensete ventricosum]|uniref:Uncharacterized protein n=1 Tax=Ensete ventricosum TaxID=4639 RepID=A0A426ZM34_ENSVE|nr:hypothetical protein B296_00039458 [Ensete ventricosum]